MDMYKLRNEFAHSELRILLKKYNTEDKNGAQNIIRKSTTPRQSRRGMS